MTVCDLAAITKPWPVEKRVSFSYFENQFILSATEPCIFPLCKTIGAFDNPYGKGMFIFPLLYQFSLLIVPL